MRTVFILFRFVVLTLLLCGCSTASRPPSGNKTLRINIQREPFTLDPRKGGDLVSSTVHFLLYEGLTRLSPKGTIEYIGAKKVLISKDQKTYTFLLRDTYWSSGDPVTAFDYERSWKAMLDPNFPSPNAFLLYEIKNSEKAKKGEVPIDTVGIKAVDQKTLVVTLERPCSYFLHITTFCSLFPFSGEGTYNGPFLLKKWKHHNEITFKKNPTYWAKNQISLDQIKMLIVENETTALHLYEIDELDIMGFTSHLPLDSLKKVSESNQLYKVDAAGTCFCVFNTDKFPFHNPNMRKAFAYSINRSEIVEHVTQMDEKIATGLIPPHLKKRSASLFLDADIAASKEYFQKGLGELQITKEDLPEIIFYYPRSEINHLLAQTLQQQWLQTLGIKVQLQAMDLKTLLEKLSRGDFFMGQYTFLAQYFDSMNLFERFKNKNNRKNFAQWEYPKFAEVLQASQVAAHIEMKDQLLDKAEELLIEEMPIAPLFHPTFVYLIKPHLKNVQFSPIGSIYLDRISTDSSSRIGNDL